MPVPGRSDDALDLLRLLALLSSPVLEKWDAGRFARALFRGLLPQDKLRELVDALLNLPKHYDRLGFGP